MEGFRVLLILLIYSLLTLIFGKPVKLDESPVRFFHCTLYIRRLKGGKCFRKWQKNQKNGKNMPKTGGEVPVRRESLKNAAIQAPPRSPPAMPEA
jgi:hypothetical protein